jgi:uncharacterized damage-inducible protein DinB
MPAYLEKAGTTHPSIKEVYPMSLATATVEALPVETIGLRQFFLDKLDREAVLIRKTLERVPEGHNNFKPHQRSMALGYLASIVAGILGWIPVIIERDELNLDDPSNESLRTRELSTRAELLHALDTGLAAARKSLTATTDQHLLTPWAFKMGGRPVQQQPRTIMIADSVFSHLAHHRGQLTVYLRLVESTVPALYGPSADEVN